MGQSWALKAVTFYQCSQRYNFGKINRQNIFSKIILKKENLRKSIKIFEFEGF